MIVVAKCSLGLEIKGSCGSTGVTLVVPGASWGAIFFAGGLIHRDFHFARRIRAFIHQHASPHARFLQRTLFRSRARHLSRRST